MTPSMRAIVIAIATILLACDRPASGSSTRTPATDTRTTDAPGDAFVSGEGTGATEQEAAAAAREALLTALLGEAGWATLAELPVDRLQPSTTGAAAGGQAHARIDLGRAEAAALISAFQEAEPDMVGPAPWRDVLYPFLKAHIAARACEQRRRLFAVECETGDTAEVDDALAQLTTEVELSPPFPDGIPADRDGLPLRPASVYVLWRGLPIANVPVIATSPEGGELQAKSDARGVAIISPSAAASWSTLDVRVDTAALLGPLRGAWPDRPVTLTTRAVDGRRFTLLFTQGDAELATALESRLEQHGAPEPATVTKETAREIASAEGDARARKIIALADASSGRIDVVLVLSAESRFAGRMGSSKSWSEASGSVQIHDAWTGRVIATIEDSATASGVGEERASRAARDKLATALADRVLASPELRLSSR